MLRLIIITFKMKKYRKMIFIVLFFCALLGLIIYRSEYLKLRYTFEVGGLLNPPELPSNCLIVNNSISKKQIDFSFFSLPRNYWTKVNEFYVFSAFVVKKTDYSLSSVALGIGSNKQNCLNYKCHIWFTTGGLKFSKDGMFTCESFGEGKFNSSVIEFSCKIDAIDFKGVPYIFVIIDKSDSKYYIPVHHKKNHLTVTPRNALCVFPDFMGLEHLYIIEFLSYHQMIGFTDILVYDNNVQYGIFNSLVDIFGNMDYLNTFSVIPWNFPYNDVNLGEEVIKKDCLYRTQGHVNFATLLSWNDYLVPASNKTIYPIFQKFKKKNTVFINVNTKKCCINSKNTKNSDRSWPLIFRKTHCIPQYHENSVNLSSSFSKHLSSIELVNVPKEEIYLNKYGICEESDINLVQDKTQFKYLIDLIGNKLLGIWRSGTL